MRYSYMVSKISTWGVLAVGVYLAVVAGLFMVTDGCQGMFCSSGIVVAMLPWIIIWEDGLRTSFFELDGMLWFWTIVSINILILYFLFAALQKWVGK